MKILLIEDRKERQKQFTNIIIEDYKSVDNKTGDKYKAIEKSFQKNSFELEEYDVIITHRSAFGKDGYKILDKLREYCEKNNKKLVFFSGGISAPFYSKQPFEVLSLNSKQLYSNNLKLFLEDAKKNNSANLLILAYGENWELNPLLNTLEKINKFLIENVDDVFSYGYIEDETEIDVIDNIIDLQKYKELDNKIKREDVESLRLEILNKIHSKSGIING